MPRSVIARFLLFIGLFALLVFLGYYGAERIREENMPEKQASTITKQQPSALRAPENAASKKEQRKSLKRKNPFAIDGEHILTFKSDKDLEDFLKRLRGTDIDVLGRNSRLRSLRLRTNDSEWLRELADKAQLSQNFSIFIPRPQPGSVQAGAVGFGTSFFEFLGISGDIRSWGEGVTIALIDSGVAEHPTFTSKFREINLTDSRLADQTGHGTSMASLIIGNDPQAPGIAPAADLISYRVIDESGTSNTFLVADAITQAVDAGAQIINISLGTYGNSLLLQQAVAYAADRGALIIASAGNEELDILALPAGYSNVISVGAVEARGEHLNFSNRGESLDISAPGYQIRAAFPELRLVETSGTSPAAAITSAAVAAVMSEFPDFSPQEAYDRLVNNTNDAYIEGPDEATGNGNLNVDKAMRNEDDVIPDLAVADITLIGDLGNTSQSELHILFENRGTTDIPAGSTGLVEINGIIKEIPLQRLGPGETQSYIVSQTLAEGQQLDIRTDIRLLPGSEDVIPGNNSRQETLPILEENE